MSNDNKYKLIIVALVLLAIYFVIKLKKNIVPDGNELLKFGSSGDNVKRLQEKLNEMIRKSVEPVTWNEGNQAITLFNPITVDGLFGNATQIALFAFTQQNEILSSQIDSLSL